MRFLSAVLCASVALGAWAPERTGIATIALGIACPAQDSCFLAASQDGFGNIIYKTTNGGANWERATLGEGGQPPSQMMFMSTAATSARSAVAGGMGFGNNAVFTSDGENFGKGPEFQLIGASQNVKPIPGTRGFGMPGTFVPFPEEEGVAISDDGGSSWRVISLPNLGSWARYAHFVNANTWYISGGSWSTFNTRSSNASIHEFTEMFHFNRETNQFKFVANNAAAAASAANGNGDGYRASIARTDDGGRTWTRTFYQEGDFYFNQIECPTTSDCFVVGEGAQNARIMASNDRGVTWRNVWNGENGYSLLGLKFLTAQEGWACGMKITIDGGITFETLFLHTRDGGRTWVENLVGESMCTDMSFHGNNPRFAHATALEPQMGVSSTYVYRQRV